MTKRSLIGPRLEQELPREGSPLTELTVGKSADPVRTDVPAFEPSALLVLASTALSCRAVGVTVRAPDGMARISASTDAVLHGADLESGRAGGGTLTGLGMADQLLVPDLRGEKRWPRWTADMVGHGVGCVLVTPFHAPRGLPGAVTAYWSDPSPLRGEVCVIARLVAQQAEVDVAREELVGQLQAAMATRLIIGQAQGILIARFGMDTGQAFAVLRRYSQDCNVKLREIAAHLVLTGYLPLRPVRRHR